MSMVRDLVPALLLLGCGPTVEPAERPDPPSIELTAAETFDYQGARLRAHGFADHVLYRRDTGDGQAHAVRVTLFSTRPGSRSRSVLLAAPLAEGNPTAQEVAAEGGVSLVSEAGDRGETERARYSGAQERAEGDAPVHLWGPGYDLRAPGFRLDTRRDTLDLGRGELVASGEAR